MLLRGGAGASSPLVAPGGTSADAGTFSCRGGMRAEVGTLDSRAAGVGTCTGTFGRRGVGAGGIDPRPGATGAGDDGVAGVAGSTCGGVAGAAAAKNAPDDAEVVVLSPAAIGKGLPAAASG